MNRPRIGFIAVASFLLDACATPEGAPPTPLRPNVLLVCVDDLRPELGCFGVEHAKSPHIDRLAEQGRFFTRHYVQAPTCGASRYALLTGRYSHPRSLRSNDALVRRARQGATTPSLPGLFRRAGYTTVSVGKVSHHPGGRYGNNWDDPTAIEMPGAWDRHVMPSGPWEHPQGAMHGLANGRARVRGQTPAFEAIDGDDRTYPDGWIAERALSELEELASCDGPFLLAVGFLRPHLPFGAPAKYLSAYEGVELPPIPHPDEPGGRTTWHGSGEFFGGYEHGGKDPRVDARYAETLRRHYLACVSYVDHLIGRLLRALAELELAEETIVCLWGDHGWHLGEHAVWGKHTLFEESLRSPLILRVPGMAKPGTASRAVVETVDVLPTLCELAGIAIPAELDGSSLAPSLLHPLGLAGERSGSAISYRSTAETLRTNRYRLIRHVRDEKTIAVELYDHETDSGETRNIAPLEPERVDALLRELTQRLGATRARRPRPTESESHVHRR